MLHKQQIKLLKQGRAKWISKSSNISQTFTEEHHPVITFLVLSVIILLMGSLYMVKFCHYVPSVTGKQYEINHMRSLVELVRKLELFLKKIDMEKRQRRKVRSFSLLKVLSMPSVNIPLSIFLQGLVHLHIWKTPKGPTTKAGEALVIVHVKANKISVLYQLFFVRAG